MKIASFPLTVEFASLGARGGKERKKHLTTSLLDLRRRDPGKEGRKEIKKGRKKERRKERKKEGKESRKSKMSIRERPREDHTVAPRACVSGCGGADSGFLALPGCARQSRSSSRCTAMDCGCR